MRPPECSPSDFSPCSDTLDRLDAYLDGDLTADEAHALEAHCAACPVCAEELALARTLQDALRTWETPPCPEHVTRAAFAEIRRRRRSALVRRMTDWGSALTRPVLRPALALATAALVALGIALLRPADVPESAPEYYTQAEIDQAVADVQQTLALLSDVGRRTGLIVRDDILEPHVVDPVRHTVDDMLQP